MKEKTIHVDRLRTISMVNGGENTISRVIHNGELKNWVGFGWIVEGKATPADFKRYPIVVGERIDKKKERRRGAHTRRCRPQNRSQ